MEGKGGRGRSRERVLLSLLLLTPPLSSLFLPVTCGAAQVRVVSVKIERPVIELFERCELTIAVDGQVADPFDAEQMALEATFRPPRGAAITVPAFYYQPFEPADDVPGQGKAPDGAKPVGEPVWKVRFTPREKGIWSYTVTLRVGGGEPQTVSSGTVEVAASARRGFVQIDQATGAYRFERGETFIPVGENLCWPPSAQPLAAYSRWIRDLVQQRANYIRLWLAPWAFRLETKETGVGRYDQLRAWQLDHLLEQSESAGLYWQLSMLDHGSFSQTHDPAWQGNPYNDELGGMCNAPNAFVTDPKAKAMFQRLLRYLVARWGYSPHLVSWELFNEIDLSDITMQDATPWIAEMSGYLRSIDPTARPITISFHHEQAEAVWRLPTIDTVQLHAYDHRDFSTLFGGPMITKLKRQFQKPVMVGEFGWIGEFMRRLDTGGIHLHDGIWASLMGGAMGGGLPWFWDTYVHPNHLERHFRPVAMFWRGEQIRQPLQRLTISVSDADLFAAGMGTANQAYVWFKNRTHNVDDYLAYRCAVTKERLRQARGQPPVPVAYPPRTIEEATATIQGLAWWGRYRIEWWDPYRGQVQEQTVASVWNGSLTVPLPTVRFDLAAKLIHLQWWERS